MSVTYVVKQKEDGPYLLARIDYPGICDLLRPSHGWREDLTRFHLLDDSAAEFVSESEARRIANGWGHNLWQEADTATTSEEKPSEKRFGEDLENVTIVEPNTPPTNWAGLPNARRNPEPTD